MTSKLFTSCLQYFFERHAVPDCIHLYLGYRENSAWRVTSPMSIIACPDRNTCESSLSCGESRLKFCRLVRLAETARLRSAVVSACLAAYHESSPIQYRKPQYPYGSSEQREHSLKDSRAYTNSSHRVVLSEHSRGFQAKMMRSRVSPPLGCGPGFVFHFTGCQPF